MRIPLKVFFTKNIRDWHIALGGALGALSRFGISSISDSEILAVFVCNILGSFVISFAIEFSRGVHERMSKMISVGFCGGISVFASFSHASVKAINDENFQLFFLNLISNFAVCVLLAYIAKKFAKKIHLSRSFNRRARL